MRMIHVLSLASTLMCYSTLASVEHKAVSSDDALKRLMEGNRRYVEENPIYPEGAQEKRDATIAGQSPFSIIVGCSDSRVPPEIIFDQNIGDLFVVRVAGNVIGPVEMDSIEFSADKLHTPFILVLGHQSCGAVKAVMQGKAAQDEIEHIAPFILPAVEATKNLPGNHLANAIKANVMLSVKKLKENPILKKLISNGKLKILGGYYELESGRVELLNSNP